MKHQRPSAVLFDLGNTLVSYYKPADFGPILTHLVDDLLRYLARQGRSHDMQTVLAQALALEAAEIEVDDRVERVRCLSELLPLLERAP